MSKRKRDYRAEYKRRKKLRLKRGLSRTKARGHSKAAKVPAKARKRAPALSTKRLQRALRVLQEQKSLPAAAKAVRVSPEQLKRLALKKRVIRKQGKYWIVKGGIPRSMLVFSGGKEVAVTVPSIRSASHIGSYMAAVRQFLRTNDPSVLKPFAGRAVKDINKKNYPFETSPNVLYRLNRAGGESFEQVYKIVI